MKINYMKKAIDILMDKNLQNYCDQILIIIAKDNPSVLVKAFKKINPETLDETLIRMIKNNETLIPCIKYLRSKTNTGLKEAKDYIILLAEKNNLTIFRPL